MVQEFVRLEDKDQNCAGKEKKARRVGKEHVEFLRIFL